MKLVLLVSMLFIGISCSSGGEQATEKVVEAESQDKVADAKKSEMAKKGGGDEVPVPPVPKETSAETMAVKATEYSKNIVCNSGAAERKIDVTDGEENEICAVNYTKMVDGEVQTQKLWSAISEKEFCADRASYLAEKLKSAGWDCK